MCQRWRWLKVITVHKCSADETCDLSLSWSNHVAQSSKIVTQLVVIRLVCCPTCLPPRWPVTHSCTNHILVSRRNSLVPWDIISSLKYYSFIETATKNNYIPVAVHMYKLHPQQSHNQYSIYWHTVNSCVTWQNGNQLNAYTTCVLT